MASVTGVLDDDALVQFVRDGYVLLPHAFDAEVAARGRAAVWREIGLSPDRPEQWTERFVHLKRTLRGGPFDAVMTPRVASAFDQLLGAGAGAWRFGEAYGWWPVLFPGHLADRGPTDLGWHVDGGSTERHLDSPEQGLVTLFLFSDIEPGGGGTALRVGSHRAVARLLAAHEPRGLSVEDLRAQLPRAGSEPIVEVVGQAGDLALVHPFLIHAVNANRSDRVRFACNPVVSLRAPMQLRAPGSPVETAIHDALDPSRPPLPVKRSKWSARWGR